MSDYLYLHHVGDVHMTDEEVCDLIENSIKSGIFQPENLKLGEKAKLGELYYLSNVVN